MKILRRLHYSLSLLAFFFMAPQALAGSFGGPVPALPGTVTGTDENAVRVAVSKALQVVLSFLALIAIIVIVIAGIRLIVSQGEEEQKEKAKKTILFAIIGLILILFARVIVGFFSKGASLT